MMDSKRRKTLQAEIAELGGGETPTGLASAVARYVEGGKATIGEAVLVTYFPAVQAGFQGHLGRWREAVDKAAKK